MPFDLVVEYERDRQVDLVFDDFSVVAPHLLFLDPGAADIADGPGCPGDPLCDRILETRRGRRAEFGHLCYRHVAPPVLRTTLVQRHACRHSSPCTPASCAAARPVSGPPGGSRSERVGALKRTTPGLRYSPLRSGR